MRLRHHDLPVLDRGSNIETMERLEKARHDMRHVAPDVQEKMPVAVMGALMRLASPHRTSHIQPGSSPWFTTDAPGTLLEIKEYIRTQVL